ncbi:MAG: AAA family ATPase [Ahrensia sp.]|nr:AAA family ATPase [Ahrensia sp.]
MLDIRTWLEGLGLAVYADAFSENDIDKEVLGDLSADDLKDIGVTSVGHRRRLLKAIEALGAEGPSDIAVTDTAPASPERATGAERRMLTVMFCDLVGSTALSVSSDPEDLQEFLSDFRSTITQAITSLGGHIAQFVGDGVLAYFGYPQSSDHDAEKAVSAALAAIEAVSAMPLFNDTRPAVRIGIATGLTVVGGVDRDRERMGESAVGETLNLAARLQAVAEPNQIVIAPATRRLVGEMFASHSIGQFELKGFDTPVEAWQVTKLSGAASRFDALRSGGMNSADFVGREAELSVLRDGLADVEGGACRLFRISGEAGVGKSSLARQVFTSDIKKAPPLVLQCSPYQKSTPFHPLKYVLERQSGIDIRDDMSANLARLRTFLGRETDAMDDRLAVVAELIGISGLVPNPLEHLSAYQRRSLEVDALAKIFTKAMLNASCVLIEDIQWMDPSTSEIMEKVVPQLRSHPTLLLATTRHAASPKWLEDGAATSLHLRRLRAEESRQMIIGLCGSTKVPDNVVTTISDRCDGIPIFIEELTRGYLEAIRARSEDWEISHIPASLSESIMARLDRLPNGRLIAPIAAVIGREFPTDILIAVSGLDEAVVEQGARELIEAGILARGHSPFGDAIRFQQMMVRDAAYELMLRRDRRAMHARTAEILTEKFPAICEGMPHVMAFQYQYAGDAEASSAQWERAGDAAAKRSAYVEAAEHFRNALLMLAEIGGESDNTERELALRLNLMGALIAGQGYSSPDVLTQVERITLLGKRLGETAQIIPALASRWVMLGSSGDAYGSLELARQAADLAESGTDADRLLSWRMCGTSLLFCARPDEAIERYDAFMELYDASQHAEALRAVHGDHALMVQLGLAEAYTLKNEPDQANQWRASAIEAARASKRAHDIGHVLAYAGCLHALLLGQHEEFARYAVELKEQTVASKLPFWEGHGDLFAGLLNVQKGRPDEGFEQARLGVKKLREVNAFSNCWYIWLADACVDHGHLEEAASLLTYARPSLELGDMRFAPEFRRVRAKLARKRGMPDDRVARALNEAMEIARSRGLAIFEPRIQADLDALQPMLKAV